MENTTKRAAATADGVADQPKTHWILDAASRGIIHHLHAERRCERWEYAWSTLCLIGTLGTISGVLGDVPRKAVFALAGLAVVSAVTAVRTSVNALTHQKRTHEWSNLQSKTLAAGTDPSDETVAQLAKHHLDLAAKIARR